MRLARSVLLLLCTLSAYVLCIHAAQDVFASSATASVQVSDWDVLSIMRTVELGSVASLSDIHVIRVPDDRAAAVPADQSDVVPYYFALSSLEAARVTGLEATARYGPGVLSTQRSVLKVKEHGLANVASQSDDANVAQAHLYSIALPLHFFQKSATEDRLADITVTVTGLLVHATEPLPKSVSQGESQNLLWRGTAFPLAPYGAKSSRVKVKTPLANIVSYETVPPVGADKMTKSGSTITFGPFDDLPALYGAKGAEITTTEARVHFPYNSPVLTMVEAHREARISHWRNRLTVEDKLWLRNDAAQLKGHFSRAQHQLSVLLQRAKTHTLTNVVMHLPPGTHGAYFVDESGNVSTSNFRPSPPSKLHGTTPAYLLSEHRASILNVRPRYPLLGGWNYTCSIGWWVKLTDGWLTHDAQTDGNAGRRFSVQVPFTPSVKDVAIDEATLSVFLPEGAADLTFAAPFPVDVKIERKWKFLDTVGKPVLVLRRQRCSERCGATVKIDYTLSVQDHYRKVFLPAFALLLIVMSTQLRKRSDSPPSK